MNTSNTLVYNEAAYWSFDQSKLNAAQLAIWLMGAPCVITKNPVDGTLVGIRQSSQQQTLTRIYCPMPFDPPSNVYCCHNGDGQPRCCSDPEMSTDWIKWLAGIAVVLFCCLTAVSAYNYFYRRFDRRSNVASYETMPEQARSSDIQQTRYAVTSVDRKIIFQSDRLVVDRNDDGTSIGVNFNDVVIYRKFQQALFDKYPGLERRHRKQTGRQRWRHRRGHVEQEDERDVVGGSNYSDLENGEDDNDGMPGCSHHLIVDDRGQAVSLSLDDERLLITVGDDGALTWVTRDMQFIYKSVVAAADDGRLSITASSAASPGHTLASGTTAAGGLNSIVSIDAHFPSGVAPPNGHAQDNEIEVNFASDEQLAEFKRALTRRRPDVSWSSYLQRDCAWIGLESGTRVSIHTWQGTRAVWLTGDGNREWYHSSEFQEIYSGAVGNNVAAEDVATNTFLDYQPNNSYL